MLKIQFGNRKFKFKSSFSDFNLSDIKIYMSNHKEVEDLIEKYEPVVNKITELQENLEKCAVKLHKVKRILRFFELYPDCITDKREKFSEHCIKYYSNLSEQATKELIHQDSIASDLQFKLTTKRIDMLCMMCSSKSFRSFVENKRGLTYQHIKDSLKFIFEKLGSFNDYWELCPIVEEFSVAMPRKFFRRKFKVFDMNKNTLLRETLAGIQAQRAFNYKSKLDSGFWDHICTFTAMIVRPINEKDEFAFNNKSFINSKKIANLSFSDKLEYYKEQFENSWNKRAAFFEKLPLNIAIGVLKGYFKKKMNS